jgi:hypothetical protein
MPFEEFAKQNQLEAVVPRILTVSGVGYGGIRELLTFEIFQAFRASLAKGGCAILYSQSSDTALLWVTDHTASPCLLQVRSHQEAPRSLCLATRRFFFFFFCCYITN